MLKMAAILYLCQNHVFTCGIKLKGYSVKPIYITGQQL
uniref:Uncharacterized protein n=1 Tax=uncultured Thiotrichaceae bacterium TaxID=298394 RepID=A0A6S6UPC3_9GAMM|nr:MAG: Unknown protein [uncultured Thiotrichaceae bacterium]